ncbi:response regulator [Tuwongella immobilis]|uniref:Response regulatory domain-containing protein n=1 Tax=Tuwongella immobilis TaxID=692036 RepID=A0A6C2YRK4_9BACT|nr:response regulator [Tuwongella immobilis]VIP03615.1 histidine kinase : Histidine kinase OS=Planctomyces brasiliensis (strain ATCC 49424 / DSM 5305 / JCM 21570 / NBRC 103401 / IFAM 1448) GN=Plabr_1841 PE=4 SV=1: Response_reg [Tuwongella immobilis]VTS04598.1 histidine kinase : Histidine kinase OS=Planctomyces brasiliensis (strain ATCC 49424 / DSM 5305 / JCM 21570 / NBRC 103401 / IFAM 1448) GN=Plabr_1841 PE=4 SV=1: Response_reg [Tuwongella immobilis]
MPHRVLVVEDHTGVGQLLKVVLERQGAAVCWVTTGSEAEQKIGDFQPTIVMIDQGLPDTDGSTLAGEIRKRYPTVRPVLIGMSGGYLESGEDAEMQGFDRCISKPIPVGQLKSLLEEYPLAESGEGSQSSG